jgi:hypothetical protein
MRTFERDDRTLFITKKNDGSIGFVITERGDIRLFDGYMQPDPAMNAAVCIKEHSEGYHIGQNMSLQTFEDGSATITIVENRSASPWPDFRSFSGPVSESQAIAKAIHDEVMGYDS